MIRIDTAVYSLLCTICISIIAVGGMILFLTYSRIKSRDPSEIEVLSVLLCFFLLIVGTCMFVPFCIVAWRSWERDIIQKGNTGRTRVGRNKRTTSTEAGPVSESNSSLLEHAFHTAHTYGTVRPSSGTTQSFRTAPSYPNRVSKGNVHAPKRDDAIVDTPFKADLRSIGLLPTDATEELDWSGRGMHVEFNKDEAVPLHNVSVINETKKVRVHAVTCRRIRLCRKTQRTHKQHTPARVLDEVRYLRAARHSHIVRLIGSYYQNRHLSILTYPVADMDLSDLLRNIPQSAERFGLSEQQLRLDTRHFFSCLSSATAFIHNSRIRHMDMKPANILVKHRTPHHPDTTSYTHFHVLITDFGISRVIDDSVDSQTDGPTSRTEMYCSPEVAAQDFRGRKSDIFSLGCVFAEILTCVCGGTVQEFLEYRTEERKSYYSNLERVVEYVGQLMLPDSLLQTRIAILRMLSREPRFRPSADELLETFPEQACCTAGPLAFEQVLQSTVEAEDQDSVRRHKNVDKMPLPA